MDCAKFGRYFFSALAILLFPKLLSSQPKNSPYYHFKTFTINDGLCSNNVNYVYKDSKGFLWIGTDRGLQRFNGSSFLTYRHINNDSNSISNENILSVTEDRQHDIWICTMGGVVKFNYKNGRLTNYLYAFKNNAKVKIGDVFLFFEDSQQRQWLGARSGLYLFDRKQQQFVHYPPLNIPGMKEDHFTRVSSISESANQEIIFSVIDGFVIVDKEGKQQYMHIPEPTKDPSNYIPCNQVMLLKDFPDEIWAAANFNGLFKYSRRLDKWVNYTSGGCLGHDLIKNQPMVWNKEEWLLGTDNLCFFNHRTGSFISAFDKEKINSISSLCQDDEGNIWISSNVNGIQLLQLSRQLFSSTQYVPKTARDKLLHFDKTSNSLYGVNIYFATGIYKLSLSDNTVKYDSIKTFAPYVTVLNNFIADNDTLYLAMEKGIWKYDLHNHRLDSIVFKSGDYSSQQAFFFNLLKSGNKIYFTGKFGTGGPFVYDQVTKTVNDLALAFQNNDTGSSYSYYPDYSPTVGTAHGQVNLKDLKLMNHKGNEARTYGYCLAINSHVLYVAMNSSDSLFTYNEITGIKKAIAFPQDYTNRNASSLLSLCVDKKQNLWCGTAGNGIFIFNIPTLKWKKHIGQQAGYFPALSSELVCDDDGNIWCNSSEGLFLFNPDNFHFTNYNLNDGLLTESNGGNLALLTGHRLASSNIAGRELSFGIINTRPANTGVQVIPISIFNLKVLGNGVLTDTLLDNMQSIILPPKNNTFSLQYAGLSVTDGKDLMYEYKLEGAEKEWHYAGNEQSLSYMNLSVGKYTLHIKCKSADERIIGKERLLIITLLPAWYQTWWFKVLAFLFVAALCFLAIRYYLRQQLRKQQATIEKEKALMEERNRIAADMHDDVGAGLSRIRYITASMKDRQKVDEDDIDKIVSLSDESVEKMNEIIWSLNQGNRNLNELIYHIRSQCATMASNANLEFICELPAAIPQVNIGWNESRNIYMLVKEAVNNAVKHAEASIITLDFLFKDDLLITISDNGKGFDAATSNKGGNGFKNFTKRSAALNGSFSIESSVAVGTKLMFRFNLSPQSHP